MRKAGNRVRISGQLIDTANGAHIWADRFEGELEDIFELQDQVDVERRRRDRAEAAPGGDRAAIRKPTESLDAHNLYMRALAQSPVGRRRVLPRLSLSHGRLWKWIPHMRRPRR